MSVELMLFLLLFLSLVPGLLMWRCLPRLLPGPACGIVVGWSAQTLLAYALAAHGLLRFFVPLFLGAVLLLTGVVWRRQPWRVTWQPWRWCRRHPEALLLLLVFLTYLGTVLLLDWSPGWDASFHCLLAQKIQLNGVLSVDWRPFEPVAVNYPQGLHVILAGIATLSGSPVELVFRLLHVVVQVLSVWLVYDLCCLFTGRGLNACLGLGCYAWLAGWGSFFSYLSWGGLPTELSFLYLLALIRVNWAAAPRWRPLLGVPLCGAMALTHHLSCVITAWIIMFYALLAWRRGGRFGLHSRLLASGVGAALTLLPLLLPGLLARASRVGTTHALAFSEEPLLGVREIVDSLGVIVTLGAAYGLFCLRRQRPWQGRGGFLQAWLLALVSGYVFLDYVYRLAALRVFARDVSALTPSRWLTVAAYPLAILAGVGWARCFRQVSSWFTPAAFPAYRRLLYRGLCLAGIGACLLAGMVRAWRLGSARVMSAPVLQAAHLVRRQTPANAIVLYAGIPGPLHWLPYLTGRAALVTPLPASENRVFLAAKQAFFSDPENLPRFGQWFTAHGYSGYVCGWDEVTGKISLIPHDSGP